MPWGHSYSTAYSQKGSALNGRTLWHGERYSNADGTCEKSLYSRCQTVCLSLLCRGICIVFHFVLHFSSIHFCQCIHDDITKP
jgi:hypothetical protein